MRIARLIAAPVLLASLTVPVFAQSAEDTTNAAKTDLKHQEKYNKAQEKASKEQAKANKKQRKALGTHEQKEADKQQDKADRAADKAAQQ